MSTQGKQDPPARPPTGDDGPEGLLAANVNPFGSAAFRTAANLSQRSSMMMHLSLIGSVLTA